MGDPKNASCPTDSRVAAGDPIAGLPGTPCVPPNNCSYDTATVEQVCRDKCVAGSELIADCTSITVDRCDALGCEGAHSVALLAFAEPEDSVVEIDPALSMLALSGDGRSGTVAPRGRVYVRACDDPPCEITFHYLELTTPDFAIEDATMKDMRALNREPTPASFDAHHNFMMSPLLSNFLVTFNIDGDTPGSMRAYATDAPSGTYDVGGDYFLLFGTWAGLPGSIYDGLTIEMLLQGHFVNRAPRADAGPDTVVECAGPDGADVLLDGSGSYDPDGPVSLTWMTGEPPVAVAYGLSPTVSLDLGRHDFQLVAADGAGLVTRDDVTIVVRDSTPPALDLDEYAGPRCLAPPDHGYVVLRVGRELAPIVSDACDPSPVFFVAGARSNQPDDGLGDGATRDDVVVYPDHVCLRSERQGTVAEGRTYDVDLSAADRSGNAGEATLQIRVTHDQSAHDCTFIRAQEVVPDDDPACQPPTAAGSAVLSADVTPIHGASSDLAGDRAAGCNAGLGGVAATLVSALLLASRRRRFS